MTEALRRRTDAEKRARLSGSVVKVDEDRGWDRAGDRTEEAAGEVGATLFAEALTKYSPDQERVPAGDPAGGQWARGGGDGGEEGTPTAVEWAQLGDKAGLVSIFSPRGIPRNPLKMTRFQYESLPVVYHGIKPGHDRKGLLFVTRSEEGAATHGDVAAFRLLPGAKLYPDLENGPVLTGEQSLLDGRVGNSSGIVNMRDMTPNVPFSRLRKYSPDQERVPAGDPAGGQFGSAGGGSTSEGSSAGTTRRTFVGDVRADYTENDAVRWEIQLEDEMTLEESEDPVQMRREEAVSLSLMAADDRRDKSRTVLFAVNKERGVAGAMSYSDAGARGVFIHYLGALEKGAGRALMSAIVARVGRREVALVNDGSAGAFYESFGFRRIRNTQGGHLYVRRGRRT